MEILFLLALPFLAFAFGGSSDNGSDPAEPEGQTVNGSDGQDSLVGSAGGDLISGFAGDDTLVGGAGDDTLRGGFGNDVVDGSAGDDYANGGAGNDFVLGLSGDDTLDGGRGNDLVLGEEDNDLITLGSGNDSNWVDDGVSPAGYQHGQLGDDTVHGDAGNDSIWDYSGQNVLDGGDGNDLVMATDDQLAGWQTAAHAADVATGGAGDDTVVGDDGDTLTGGAGSDLIVIGDVRDDNQAVTVTDYNGTQDSLELHVDETVADLTQWTLFAQTEIATGNVTLGLENNANPAQTIELAFLQSPDNFAISQVQLFQN